MIISSLNQSAIVSLEILNSLSSHFSIHINSGRFYLVTEQRITLSMFRQLRLNIGCAQLL